jgi:hypothetical protein
MKRSINRWTMSLATAGVLALPVTSFAKAQEQAPPQQQQQPQQQPQPAQPQPEPAQPAQPKPEQPQPAQPQPEQPQQPQPQPQPAQPQPTQPQPTEPQTPKPSAAAQSSTEQAVSPQDHLRQAQQAVDAIPTTSVPAKSRSELAQLKRHLSNLEKMGSSPSASAAPSAGKSDSSSKPNWGTEVAAIDKIITEIVGTEASSSSTSTPGATGTAGAKTNAAIDDAARAKLMEVRTHITAYAAGMAGTSSTPKTDAPSAAAAPEPSTTASAATASPATASPSSASPTSQQPSAAPSSPQNPAAGSQNPPSTQPDPSATAQQPPAAGQQPPAGGQAPAAGNTDEAHRHLVTARDTLSQLTQLPAAAQLSGEARTQVSQLISNFNELIGNPPDWRVSYQKVSANLTALLGPDNASDTEAQAAAPANPPAASATPGAVGTSGTATVELDPSIKAKLVEFRRSLSQFEKAAAGK